VRARLQLRERECESLRGRAAGAGALSSSERRQLAAALEAAAQQRAVLERQLSESQAKVWTPGACTLRVWCEISGHGLSGSGADSQRVNSCRLVIHGRLQAPSGACRRVARQAPSAALSSVRSLAQASSYQRRNRRKQQEADDIAAERAVLRIELSSAQQKLAALQGGTGAPPSLMCWSLHDIAVPAGVSWDRLCMLHHPLQAGSTALRRAQRCGAAMSVPLATVTVPL
jgi:hypothetical protein